MTSLQKNEVTSKPTKNLAFIGFWKQQKTTKNKKNKKQMTRIDQMKAMPTYWLHIIPLLQNLSTS